MAMKKVFKPDTVALEEPAAGTFLHCNACTEAFQRKIISGDSEIIEGTLLKV